MERALILAEPGEVIGLPHLPDGRQDAPLPHTGGLTVRGSSSNANASRRRWRSMLETRRTLPGSCG